jgi:hypothetical protein
MPTRRSLSWLLVPSLLLLWSGTARALRLVALAPQIKPSAANEIRDRFHEAVVRGLSTGADVVPVADVRMWATGDPQLFQCDAGPCAAQITSLMKADRAVITSVEQVGKTYTVKMRAFDTQGEEVGATSEGCDICSLREAAESVSRAAQKLVPLLAAKKEAPVEKEKPKEKAAAAPEEEEPHPAAPTAAAPPAAPVTPPVEKPLVAQAEPQAAGAAAPPTAPPKPETGAAPGPPLRPLGITALVLGGALIVPTAVFGYYAAKGTLYYNSDGTACTPANANATNCPRQLDRKSNLAGSVVSGVLAGVALTTGAILLYLDHRRHRASSTPTVGAAPIPGGFAVAASLDF